MIVNNTNNNIFHDLSKKYPQFVNSKFVILNCMHDHINPNNVHNKNTNKYGKDNSNPLSKVKENPTKSNYQRPSYKSNDDLIKDGKGYSSKIRSFDSQFLVEQTLQNLDIVNTLKQINSPPNSLCGMISELGDLYVRCYDCDLTQNEGIYSIYCASCFENSNHKGHKVQFFIKKTIDSGYCDCGDKLALNEKGFCDKHGKANQSMIDELVEQFPSQLKSNFNEVLFQAFCGFFALCEYIIMYNKLDELPLVNMIFKAIFDYIKIMKDKHKSFLYLLGRVLSSSLPIDLNNLKHDCTNTSDIKILINNTPISSSSQSSSITSHCQCIIFENLIRYQCMLNQDNKPILIRLINDFIVDENTKFSIVMAIIKMYKLSFYTLKRLTTSDDTSLRLNHNGNRNLNNPSTNGNVNMNRGNNNYSNKDSINPNVSKLNLIINSNNELISMIMNSPYLENLFNAFDDYFDTLADNYANEYIIEYIDTVTDNIMVLLDRNEICTNIVCNTRFLSLYMKALHRLYMQSSIKNYTLEPLESEVIDGYLYPYFARLVKIEIRLLDIFDKLLKNMILYHGGNGLNGSEYFPDHDQYQQFSLHSKGTNNIHNLVHYQDEYCQKLYQALGQILKTTLDELQGDIDIRENSIFLSNELIRIFVMTYWALYDDLKEENINQFMNIIFGIGNNCDWSMFWSNYLGMTLRTMLFIHIVQKRSSSEDYTVMSHYRWPYSMLSCNDMIFCQMAILSLDEDAISKVLIDSIFFIENVKLNSDIKAKPMILSHIMLKNRDFLIEKSIQNGLNLIDNWLQILIEIFNDEICYYNAKISFIKKNTEVIQIINNYYDKYSQNFKKIGLNLMINILSKQPNNCYLIKDAEKSLLFQLKRYYELEKYFMEICHIDLLNKKLKLKEEYKGCYDYFFKFDCYQTDLYCPPLDDDSNIHELDNDNIQRKGLSYVTNDILNVQKKVFMNALPENIIKLLMTYHGRGDQNNRGGINDKHSSKHSANYFRLIHMHLDLILNNNVSTDDKAKLMSRFEKLYLNNSVDMVQIKEYWNSDLIPNYKKCEAGKIYMNGLLSRIEKEYLPLKKVNQKQMILSNGDNNEVGYDEHETKKRLMENKRKQIQEAFKQKQLKALGNFEEGKIDHALGDNSVKKQRDDNKGIKKQAGEAKNLIGGDKKYGLGVINPDKETCLICNEKIEAKAYGIPINIITTQFNYDSKEYLDYCIILKNILNYKLPQFKKPELEKADKIKVYNRFSTCGHYYHAKCLKDTSHCPYCRQTFSFLLTYQDFPMKSWNHKIESLTEEIVASSKVDNTPLVSRSKSLFKPYDIPSSKYDSPSSSIKLKSLVSSKVFDFMFSKTTLNDKEKLPQLLLCIRKIIIQLFKNQHYIGPHEYEVFIKRDLILHRKVIDALEGYALYLCNMFEEWPMLYDKQTRNIFQYFVKEIVPVKKVETSRKIKPIAGEIKINQGDNVNVINKGNDNDKSIKTTKIGNNSVKLSHISEQNIFKKSNTQIVKSPNTNTNTNKTPTNPSNNLSKVNKITAIYTSNHQPKILVSKSPYNVNIKSGIKPFSPLNGNINKMIKADDMKITKVKRSVSNILANGNKDNKVQKRPEENELEEKKEDLTTKKSFQAIEEEEKVTNMGETTQEDLMIKPIDNRQIVERIEMNLLNDELSFLEDYPSKDKINAGLNLIKPLEIQEIQLKNIDINMHYAEYFFNYYITHIITSKLFNQNHDISSKLSLIFPSYYLYLVFLISLPKILPKKCFVKLKQSETNELLNLVKNNTEYWEKFKGYLLESCKNLLPLIMFYDGIINTTNVLDALKTNDIELWVSSLFPGLTLKALVNVIFPKYIQEEYMIFGFWKTSLENWIADPEQPIAKASAHQLPIIKLPLDFQEFHSIYQNYQCQLNKEKVAELVLCLLCGYICCKNYCRPPAAKNLKGNIFNHAMNSHCGEIIYLNLMTLHVELISQNEYAYFINKLYTDGFGRCPYDKMSKDDDSDWSQYKLDMSIIHQIERWVEQSNIAAKIDSGLNTGLLAA